MSQPRKKAGAKADEALLKAVRKGDLKAVCNRIAAGVDVNAAAKHEPAAIFAAIEKGNMEMVQALLAAGANVNCIAYPTSGSSLKSTPLCFAIEQNNWSIVEAFIKAGANIALEPYKGENAAGFAAKQAAHANLASTAPDEEWFGEHRTKARKEAAAADCEHWMQFIQDAIAQGVKVRDYWLWNAIKARHVELALLLISTGVDPNTAPFGDSALVTAIEVGRDEIALGLIKAGADVNLAAEIPPLLIAVSKNRIAVVSALLDAGADINVADDVTIGDFGEPRVKDETDAKGKVTARITHVSNPPEAEGATALIMATRLGHFDLVKLLVERGVDLNRGDRHGLTALAWALRLESQEIIESLRKAGAQEPEFLEGSPNTALWLAARNGEVAKVEAILKRGVKPDDPIEDNDGKHFPLVSAAREGHLEVVQLLLRHSASVNIGASENWTVGITPLMAAAREGQVEVIKTLLAAGADLQAKDKDFEGGGETALHYAARSGHVAAIQALIAGGAKINAKASGGTTPLLTAISEKRRDAAKALLAAGADPNAGPSVGFVPLYSAASEHDLEMVKLLLDNGASPLPRSKKTDVLPLVAAAGEGSLEIVQLLLKAGAPVNGQNVVGDTALNRAALRGHEDIVKELLAAGADPNIGDRERITPLIAAALSGQEAVIPILLDAKADVNAVDEEGRTCLGIAREKRNKKIIALIEAAMAAAPPKPKADSGKPAKPVGSRAAAPNEADEEEEEFEPPDFSEAAANPDFQTVAREVEKLCGAPPESLDDIDGGYSFAVTKTDTEKLLADNHQRLLQRGAYLFRCHQDYTGKKDKLALLPTTDWADVLHAFQTNGANYELTPDDIIKWMQKLSGRQPFIITGVGWDWLEGRFTGPVKEPRKLAHQMYKFCPDIVDQGVGSVKNLAQKLEQDGYFFFWWD